MDGSTDTVCVLCESSLSGRFEASERMFGMGGTYSFARCSTCGMLSQLDPPSDMSPFYSEAYQSFGRVSIKQWHGFPPKRWLSTRRNSAQQFGSPKWASLIAAISPSSGVADAMKLLTHSDPRKGYDLRILDIGCGSGGLLCDLASVGFRKLDGIDPFVRCATNLDGRVRIRKQSHFDLSDEQYDFIMLNHSLEHMRDQIAAICKAKELLSTDGIMRIEVPVADCEAYRIYGNNWVELDAPRHFHLHTRVSLSLLAERCGLNIIEMREMGGPFEFWGSELYRRGFPLFDKTGKALPTASVFSEEEMYGYIRLSNSANDQRKGGRVAIYATAFR